MRMYLRALLILSLFIAFGANAQDFEVPSDLPSTKEEFANSEKDMIAAAKWLEATAMGSQMDKRIKVNAWVIGWIINSPSVTLEIHSDFVDLFDKNPHLNTVWMANYARYILENNYSKDQVQAHVAALRSVINCYNLGGDLKKDKSLAKLIEKDKEGKLEDWVKDALGSK